MTTRDTTATPTAEAALKTALARQGNVFAVLDAARAPGGVFEAGHSGLLCKSLYEGPRGERLSHVAPYLVEFRLESAFGRWWLDNWGDSVGILFVTPTSFADVRKHCRTLMIVRGHDEKKYYFRFYDPRVLRSFLPACSAAEAQRFFGPITAVHCEGPNGEELLTYSAGIDGLTEKRCPLVASEA